MPGPTRERRRGPGPPHLYLVRQVLAAGTLVLAVLLVVAVGRAVWPDGPTERPSAAPATSVGSVREATPSRTATAPPPGTAGTATSTAPSPTPAYPVTGDGRVTVLDVPRWSGADELAPGARTVAYTVETEGGLGVDPAGFVATVEATLHDPRGWQGKDGVRFVNVTPAQSKAGQRVDIRIVLASPTLTDELCGPVNTRGDVSCNWAGRSVLNVKRWVTGAAAYGADLEGYRTYLVNHEVGHGLGHGHAGCPVKGQRAKVMLTQTLGLQGCTPWPWPVGA